ncbi:MAG: hypothetical protein ACLQHS_06860 [Candidatus Limnocylindrales bacterium]
MTVPNLSTIVAAAASQKGLRLRDDLHDTGWAFWELRSLNMHRVVGLLKEYRSFADVRDLEGEIRGSIARNFHRSWWRGLAYGVVAQMAPTSWTPDDLTALVDIYENRKGVLQWVVLVATDNRSAVGVHTWEQVYLSPVYRETLEALSAAGYRAATAVKGKDGLLKVLTGVSEQKGVSFPEFRDRP